MVYRVGDAVRIPDRHFARANRHGRGLAYSLFIRHAIRFAPVETAALVALVAIVVDRPKAYSKMLPDIPLGEIRVLLWTQSYGREKATNWWPFSFACALAAFSHVDGRHIRSISDPLFVRPKRTDHDDFILL